METQLLQGMKLEIPNTPQRTVAEPSVIRLPATVSGRHTNIELSNIDLSRHVLIVGGIGSGKTNTFKQMINCLSNTMTDNDVTVIFDTKGEYLSEFYRDGDVILSNDDSLFPPGYNIDYWNIFEEVLIEPQQLKDNINEISKMLFSEQTQRTTNPFFPNAAKDIFYAFVLACVRCFLAGEDIELNNKELSAFFNEMDVDKLNALLEKYPDLRGIKNYISAQGVQTQGVLSEVTRLVRDIFTGSFEKIGNLSMRRTIREKGNKRVFVEYDLGLGNVLSPIYRLLIDLAIKESLSRDKLYGENRGNVYFVLDEFRLLPHLEHIDNGINFGRSQGAKFIIGMQNIQQINEAYGENTAGSILSGLSTKFLFRVNDYETREYIKNLLGKNRYVEAFYSKDTTRGLVEEVIEGNTVEDWVISAIPTGMCIYISVGTAPYIAKLSEYKEDSQQKFLVKRRTEPIGDTAPAGSFNICVRYNENDRVAEGAFNIKAVIGNTGSN